MLSNGTKFPIAAFEDHTSTTSAKSNLQQKVSNMALPGEDISPIEYTTVKEPEYMVMFEEKEYQQVQVSSTYCIDTMETDIQVDYIAGVLCSSNMFSTEQLCSYDIVLPEVRTSGLLFFYIMPCYVGVYVSD